jgi:hypothetical protein
MKRNPWWILSVMAASSVAGSRVEAQFSSVFYSENFDGLVDQLGPSVNERQGFPTVTRVATDINSEPIPGVYSAAGPAGWVVNNGLDTYQGSPTVGNAGVPGQGVADYGVDEWEGWSFVDKVFWYEKDDQRRSEFTNASGTVAVVDPDEYFDLSPLDGSSGGPGNPTHGGYLNTGLRTPSIALPGLGTTSAGIQVSFDSSWRDEAFDDDHGPNPSLNGTNNQSVEVLAVFNTGETQTVTAWNSDSTSPNFKNDAPNESLSFSVFPNTAATSVELYFNLANAANDWWWAIDNVAVADIDINTGLPSSTVFSEGFDSIPLGPSVNERRSLIPSKVTAVNNDPATSPRPNSFTHTAPAGWNVDNGTTPGLGDDNIGVFEWEGWSFATREFWNFADTQDRQLFTKGEGVIAIADGDEWDDLGNPDGLGELNTLLETGSIPLPTLAAGERFALQFDSSWRAEDAQTAILTADYGSGPVELLRWESDSASAFFHDDNVNETVLIEFDPQGAGSVKLAFRYIGTDDWWWAIDNVQLGVIPEPTSAVLAASVLLAGLGMRRRD